MAWTTDTEARAILAEMPDGAGFSASEDLDLYLAEANVYLANDSLYSFPDSPTDKMKQAETRLGKHLFESGAGDMSDFAAQGVKRVKIGNFEQEWHAAGSRNSLTGNAAYPSAVRALIAEYLLPPAWGSNVTRQRDPMNY